MRPNSSSQVLRPASPGRARRAGHLGEQKRAYAPPSRHEARPQARAKSPAKTRPARASSPHRVRRTPSLLQPRSSVAPAIAALEMRDQARYGGKKQAPEKHRELSIRERLGAPSLKVETWRPVDPTKLQDAVGAVHHDIHVNQNSISKTMQRIRSMSPSRATSRSKAPPPRLFVRTSSGKTRAAPTTSNESEMPPRLRSSQSEQPPAFDIDEPPASPKVFEDTPLMDVNPDMLWKIEVMQDVFASIDADDNARVSKQELEKVLSSSTMGGDLKQLFQTTVDSVFDQFDTNGDGEVSKNEFVNGMIRQGGIQDTSSEGVPPPLVADEEITALTPPPMGLTLTPPPMDLVVDTPPASPRSPRSPRVDVDSMFAQSKADAERARVVEFLRSVALFRRLPEDALVKLHAVMLLETFPAGAAIVTQGGAAHSMFVIKEGIAHAQTDGIDIMDYTEGDSFGEAALLNNGKRGATVRALTKTTCYMLDRVPFIEIAPTLDAEIAAKVELYAAGCIQHAWRTKKAGERAVLENAESLPQLSTITVTHDYAAAVLAHGEATMVAAMAEHDAAVLAAIEAAHHLPDATASQATDTARETATQHDTATPPTDTATPPSLALDAEAKVEEARRETEAAAAAVQRAEAAPPDDSAPDELPPPLDAEWAPPPLDAVWNPDGGN